MRALSAADVTRLTRKLRQLQRANRRLRADLRAARRLLMRLLVRREGDGERIRGRFSRRAGQYALLMIRSLEGAGERKHRYYAGILENGMLKDPHALEGLTVAAASERIAPASMLRLPPAPGPTGWRAAALALWRRLAARLRSAPGPRRAYWWSRHWHLVPQRGESLVGRALEVAQAFEQQAARTGGGLALDGRDHPWALEGVRQEIIRGAGSHYDPLMVEALVAAWSEITAFYRSHRAA